MTTHAHELDSSKAHSRPFRMSIPMNGMTVNKCSALISVPSTWCSPATCDAAVRLGLRVMASNKGSSLGVAEVGLLVLLISPNVLPESVQLECTQTCHNTFRVS